MCEAALPGSVFKPHGANKVGNHGEQKKKKKIRKRVPNDFVFLIPKNESGFFGLQRKQEIVELGNINIQFCGNFMEKNQFERGFCFPCFAHKMVSTLVIKSMDVHQVSCVFKNWRLRTFFRFIKSSEAEHQFILITQTNSSSP